MIGELGDFVGGHERLAVAHLRRDDVLPFGAHHQQTLALPGRARRRWPSCVAVATTFSRAASLLALPEPATPPVLGAVAGALVGCRMATSSRRPTRGATIRSMAGSAGTRASMPIYRVSATWPAATSGTTPRSEPCSPGLSRGNALALRHRVGTDAAGDDQRHLAPELFHDCREAARRAVVGDDHALRIMLRRRQPLRHGVKRGLNGYSCELPGEVRNRLIPGRRLGDAQDGHLLPAHNRGRRRAKTAACRSAHRAGWRRPRGGPLPSISSSVCALPRRKSR